MSYAIEKYVLKKLFKCANPNCGKDIILPLGLMVSTTSIFYCSQTCVPKPKFRFNLLSDTITGQ